MEAILWEILVYDANISQTNNFSSSFDREFKLN